MKKKTDNIKTYYAPANCEACDCKSNWGELIAVKLPHPWTTSIKRWGFVCPRCYAKAVKRSKTPTCLTNPDRLNELLERYKEE